MKKTRIHYKQYGRTKIAYGIDLGNGYVRLYLESGNLQISIDDVVKIDF